MVERHCFGRRRGHRLVMAAAVALGAGGLLYWVWNAIGVALFAAPALGFGQALTLVCGLAGLLVASGLLARVTGGHRTGAGGARS